MSRVGKVPINVPEEVKVDVSGKMVKVTGAKGTLNLEVPRELGVELADEGIVVSAKSSSKLAKSMHGTYRALISNMVTGVTQGYEKKLELVGAGYRASLSGNKLVLQVGFSHPVEFEAPEGITFKVEKNFVTIEGIDKHEVGQVAANVRAVRPPEPYKGKGIKYEDEIVRRKPGKAAKAQGAEA